MYSKRIKNNNSPSAHWKSELSSYTYWANILTHLWVTSFAFNGVCIVYTISSQCIDYIHSFQYIDFTADTHRSYTSMLLHFVYSIVEHILLALCIGAIITNRKVTLCIESIRFEILIVFTNVSGKMIVWWICQTVDTASIWSSQPSYTMGDALKTENIFFK